MNERINDVPQLDGVPLAPPTDDTFMDPRGYTSPAFFELEMHRVLPRCWMFVGDANDIAEPGDYLTEVIGREPVVVVSGDDDNVRAFSNVCPHRAAIIADGTGNCGRFLECPYHGWKFATDGHLAAVPYKSSFVGSIDLDTLGLTPIRIEMWERWMFINVSGDAPPLLDWLEDMPATLAHHDLSATTRVHQLDDHVQANWKILMDNAFCDYHLPIVHENSLGQFIDPRSLEESVNWYTGTLHAPSPPPEEGGYERRAGIDGPASEGSFGFGVFPNFFVSAYPNGGCTVMWWTPLTINTSRARVMGYSHDPETDPRAGLDLLKAVQTEDYAICENVQHGVRSTLYRPGPQHGLELRVRGFQQLLITMLAEEVAAQRQEDPARGA